MSILGRKLALIALSAPLFAFGQGSQLPKYTVATLPAASTQPHYIVQVIDGTSSTDCATGGGAQNVACVNIAGVWHALGSVSPTFTGDLNVTGAVAAGAVNAPVIGGTQYVGQGSNTTVQAAITAAGTTGSVVIPADYTGHDTYTNTNNIQITDLRLYNAPNTILQMNSVFPLLDMAAGGDVTQIATAIQNGSATSVVWGDSIGEGISQIASENNWVFTLQKSLQQHYFKVNWNFLNYSIGGVSSSEAVDPTFVCEPSPIGNQFYRPSFVGVAGGDGPAYSTWPSGCVAGTSWMQTIKNAAPDIVFYALGQNDAGLGPVLALQNDLAAITYMQSFPKPPTIVLVTNTTASQFSDPPLVPYNPRLLQIMQGLRDLGKQYNLPVMDAGRLYLLYRDGTDYAQSRFTLNSLFSGYPSGVTPGGAPEWIGTANLSLQPGYMAVTGTGGTTTLNQIGTDFAMFAQFANMTVGSTQGTSSAPAFQYRCQGTSPTQACNPGALGGYQVAITRCNAFCTNPNLVSIALTQGASTVVQGVGYSTATVLNLMGRVEGAHHQWYVEDNSLSSNGSTGGTVIASIDVYDYNYLSPGTSSVGVQQLPGTIALFSDYIGNPQTVLASGPVPEASMIGLNDWEANTWNSMGGDAIHHPSAIGHDAFYAAAFAPVLKTIDRSVAALGTDTNTYIRNPNYSASLVDNGNFVLGTTGWATTYSGVAIAASSSSPAVNGKSLAITTTALYQGASPLRRYTALAGQNYILSAWVRSDGTFNIYGELIAYDGSGNILGNAVIGPTASTSWTQISGNYVLPANTSYLGIEFARYDNGGGTHVGYVTGVSLLQSATTAQIGTGTPAAGMYVDGAAGAWTALPLTPGTGAAGSALCQFSAGPPQVLGHCTSIVGAGGACTCAN